LSCDQTSHARQADDLGGGVYKKRLNDNMHRSIIIAKAGRHWIYAYLYAKKDHEETQMTPATINIVTAEQVGDFLIRLQMDSTEAV
jgi:hypothetical protein